jgi:MraZ protein
MFRGNHPAKIDEKGRLKMPAAFKALVDGRNVKQFYITSTNGKTVQVWPLPDWEEREKQVTSLGEMTVMVRNYLRLTSYYGQQAEMDNQGRLLMPQKLRNSATLDNMEADIIGMGSYIEIHNHDELEKELPVFTDDDSDKLAAILRQQG